MSKKLSERFRRWLKNQKCTGAIRGWRYLVVELAERVEALERPIEAVEPGEHTCGECGHFHKDCYMGLAHTSAPKCFVTSVDPKDTDVRDATILNLREACNIWEQRCLKSEQELAEAKADTRLVKACDEAMKLDQSELAEAKAEIERQAGRLDKLYAEAANLQIQLNRERCEAKVEIAELKDVHNRQRDTIHCLNERFSALYAEFVENKEELASYTASVNADADLGRMVRGMADGTRLTKFFTGYAIEAQGRCDSIWYDAIGMGPRGIGARYVDPAEALRSIQEGVDGL